MEGSKEGQLKKAKEPEMGKDREREREREREKTCIREQV